MQHLTDFYSDFPASTMSTKSQPRYGLNGKWSHHTFSVRTDIRKEDIHEFCHGYTKMHLMCQTRLYDRDNMAERRTNPYSLDNFCYLHEYQAPKTHVYHGPRHYSLPINESTTHHATPSEHLENNMIKNIQKLEELFYHGQYTAALLVDTQHQLRAETEARKNAEYICEQAERLTQEALQLAQTEAQRVDTAEQQLTDAERKLAALELENGALQLKVTQSKWQVEDAEEKVEDGKRDVERSDEKANGLSRQLLLAQEEVDNLREKLEEAENSALKAEEATAAAKLKLEGIDGRVLPGMNQHLTLRLKAALRSTRMKLEVERRRAVEAEEALASATAKLAEQKSRTVEEDEVSQRSSGASSSL